MANQSQTAPGLHSDAAGNFTNLRTEKIQHFFVDAAPKRAKSLLSFPQPPPANLTGGSFAMF